MDEEIRETTFSFTDLAPAGWFTDLEGSSVWISLYRIQRITEADLPLPRSFDLCDVRAEVFYGTLKYPAKITVVGFSENELKFKVPESLSKETEKGANLLLLTPLKVDGSIGDEPHAKEKISAAVGLLAAINGRNMVYEHLVEFEQHMDARTTRIDALVENPFVFNAPDLSADRLQFISRASDAITALDSATQNRIRLSLRWLQSATHGGGGVDSFLKYWFAIETLGMPHTANIRPVVESMARIYGISYGEAQKRFLVGRLSRVRSEIVHNGRIIPIKDKLLQFLEAVYADLLYEQIGLATEYRAETLLSSKALNLEVLINAHGSTG
jgi:Apea-like HEPN